MSNAWKRIHEEQDLQGLVDVKNVILVSSGKGGVGKSTVNSNLACAIHQLGYRVGVLDADIHGPSQNHMFGLMNEIKPAPQNPQWLLPQISYGIKVSSIASRVNAQKSLSWRGAMVTAALNDLIFYTDWGQLDYLIVDLPPGTGDVQITLCEKFINPRAVVVSSPQQVAILDTVKGIDLFVNRQIEIAGIIENMSGYVCSNCGSVENIFGSDSVCKVAESFNINFLGKIPLTTEMQTCADQGKPLVITNKKHPISQLYIQIAKNIIQQ
jgi:ATP-binding protein involved in chromosome partitioning